MCKSKNVPAFEWGMLLPVIAVIQSNGPRQLSYVQANILYMFSQFINRGYVTLWHHA